MSQKNLNTNAKFCKTLRYIYLNHLFIKKKSWKEKIIYVMIYNRVITLDKK